MSACRCAVTVALATEALNSPELPAWAPAWRLSVSLISVLEEKSDETNDGDYTKASEGEDVEPPPERVAATQGCHCPISLCSTF